MKTQRKAEIFMRKILSILFVTVIIICMASFTASAAETDKIISSATSCSTTCVNRDNAVCQNNTDCTNRSECTNANRNNCRKNCTAAENQTCPKSEYRQRRNRQNCSNGNGCSSAQSGHCSGRGAGSGNCRNQ